MLGAIISAAGSLAGGILGSNNAKKQLAAQRELAQNQLQWKAADAEKAGISKYFAMGAPTANFSPVNVGDYGISDAAAKLGAGIDGQGGPSSTTTHKIGGITSQIAAAQLDGLKIDNDIKRAELASKLAIATQPGAGGILDHQISTSADGVKVEKKVAPAAAEQLQRSLGISPEVDLYRSHTGLVPHYPQVLQEAFENDRLGRYQWNLRNRIMPMWDMDMYGSVAKPPAGQQYMYNPITGQYVLYPAGIAPRDVKSMYDRLRR